MPKASSGRPSPGATSTAGAPVGYSVVIKAGATLKLLALAVSSARFRVRLNEDS
jgi:hypothetical protein